MQLSINHTQLALIWPLSGLNLSASNDFQNQGGYFQVKSNSDCGNSLYEPQSRQAQPLDLKIIDRNSRQLLEQIKFPYFVVDNGWAVIYLAFP